MSDTQNHETRMQACEEARAMIEKCLADKRKNERRSLTEEIDDVFLNDARTIARELTRGRRRSKPAFLLWRWLNPEEHSIYVEHIKHLLPPGVVILKVKRTWLSKSTFCVLQFDQQQADWEYAKNHPPKGGPTESRPFIVPTIPLA